MELQVAFGRWHPFVGYLDYNYNNLVTRLVEFAREAGIDRYGRVYDFEELVDFVITNRLSEYSVDYIYRHYVYHIVSRQQPIDISEEEFRYYGSQFVMLKK